MKARIVVLICCSLLFCLMTGCISELSYMDRMIAVGAVAVGYGALQSQSDVLGGPIAVTPGTTPGTTPTTGGRLPWKFPAGSDTPLFTVTQFNGPFVRHEIFTDGTTSQQKDFTVFYGMLTHANQSSGWDADRGIGYKIAYYDENGRFLFRDEFLYGVGIELNSTVPFMTLYEPVREDIAGATIEEIYGLYDVDEDEHLWYGSFVFSNLSVSAQGVAGKLVQFGTAHEDGDEDTEQNEVVIVAAFYDNRGNMVDVVIDDGGPNHVWEWGLFGLPGTSEKYTMASFDITSDKSFSTYTLHIGFLLEE